jgi:3-deoxy-D-manno-octulosonate 8-phosphate phosphatase (KDO 8-P phosphatase)
VIKLLALDIDGVLTDGSIGFTSGGDEVKTFNAKDGLGLRLVQRAGIAVALITGRVSAIHQRRADELGITYLYQDIARKLPVLEQLCADLGIGLDAVAYMGDDLPDLPVLEALNAAGGLSACPSDAVYPVRQACRFISTAPGGRGAVRDLCDWLVANQPATASKTGTNLISG